MSDFEVIRSIAVTLVRCINTIGSGWAGPRLTSTGINHSKSPIVSLKKEAPHLDVAAQR